MSYKFMSGKFSSTKFKTKATREIHEELGKVQPSESNLLAALSYMWLLCLIPLFFGRKNPFVQFHARQGAVLLVLELLFGWFPIFLIIFIVASLIGILKALQGEKWSMPIVKTILEKVVNNKG